MRRFLSTLAIAGAVFSVYARAALASEVEFHVQADRQEITLDDSVSLKFSVRAEGSLGNVRELEYNAPDFDLVNEYSGTFIESYYRNGSFGMKHNHDLTRVLRPKKQGALTVTGIRIRVGNQTLTAPDITIQVTAGGAGTPPPPGYGGGGSGLRGAGKPAKGHSILIRAEVDKQRAYKGEQLIVSYYLYRRVRASNIQVDKYPTLNGFLREDLEMPVLGARLDSEPTVLDGVSYERSLLVRYLAYPLKDGKLKLDPMAIRANYYASQAPGTDDDDPFFNFFQQMAPRLATARSEPVTIEVMPLPDEGKPAGFKGTVGEFEFSASVDKAELRANEALTLTVKVEGKGNLSTVEEPSVDWPSGVERYEAKTSTRAGRGGIGSKTFEILLIPRVAGPLTLPALEFSYFDPAQARYVSKSTQPIQINVLEAAAGATASTNPVNSGQVTAGASQSKAPVLRPIRPLDPNLSGASGEQGIPLWRWLYWLSTLGFLALVATVIWDRVRARPARKKKSHAAGVDPKRWQRVRALAQRASEAGDSRLPWTEVTQAYELLTGAVYDSIDAKLEVGARALSRMELRERLVGSGHLTEEAWKRIDELLEYAEMVRFASSAGAVVEEDARKKLVQWINEAQRLESALVSST